MKIEL